MHRSLIAVLLTATVARHAVADEPIVNSLGMKLVPIAAGEFVMGAGDKAPASREVWNERDWDESPAHPVRIARPFFMGATEVTNSQYEHFDAAHRSIRGKFGSTKADDEPVTHVTWKQAADFCQWLSEKEGKSYRLPTEAEWEYACRAGTTTPFPAGDTLTSEQANFGYAPGKKTRIGAVAVGRYPANKWGLHDMVGNVAEWCHDWYGPYESGAQTDPVGRVDGDTKAVRGWSFLPVSHPRGAARYCRSSNRSSLIPEDANRATGFRVVLGAMPTTKPLPVPTPPLRQQNVRPSPAVNAGPDPSKSYYVDFRNEKTLPPVPKDAWGPIFGAWNHFTAVCVCPNGDVLAAWYTTVDESGRECAQAATRLRAGADRWDPPSFFFGPADCNTHAPVLLREKDRIYHFCTQSLAGWDDAAEAMRVSDDSGSTWSKPRIILTREDPRRMSQPCSAYVSKAGKLVVALDGDFGHRDERIMTSADRGETWKVAGGDIRKAAGKYAIHPCIVERADGAILSFMRGPHPMPAFASHDQGETWQLVETPFPGIGTGQKAPALKLAGGALLLCSFDTRKSVVNGGTFAALSFDDGKTWAHVRKVEGVGGYMSLAQAANGVIYLVGSQCSCVAFNEAWLKEGTPFPTAK